MFNYKQIEDNLFTNGKHRFIKKACECCGSDFFCRKDKIKTKKTCNRKCYQQKVEENNRYLLSNYSKQIIIGSLLSDGTLGNTNNGKNYFWSHTSINEDYIDFLINETKILLNKHSVQAKDSIILGRAVKQKKSFRIRSRCSTTFTEMRNEWYPNGIKIVPKNISITPIVLLHWYLGDGYITPDNIGLCTDSFDTESINFLMYQLISMNLKPILSSRNRILIPNKRVIEFLDMIGDCPVDSFKYKWETKILESYINRDCAYCGNIFTAEWNHQRYCNSKCAKK